LDHKKAIIWLGGIFTLLIFVSFSVFVKDTEVIWFEARAIGLLAYAFLFASVAGGEWKLITNGKSDFPFFKYHHGISVASLVLVLLHFIAGFLDNYKWGQTLTFTQYLGFSFSDKWVAFLSLGVLAFYMLVLVGLTSATTARRSLSVRSWRLIHYTSYVAFFIAYVHAVNLGTDVKTSSLSSVLHPAIVFSLILVVALLITRAFSGLGAFSDMAEAGMVVAFFILLLSAGALIASSAVYYADELNNLRLSIAQANESDNAAIADLQALLNRTNQAKAAIAEVRNGQNV